MRRSRDDEIADGEIEACKREREQKNGVHPLPVEPPRFCNCAELIINGKRFPIPPGHDCAYIKARAALVWQAVWLTTEKIGDPVGNALSGYRWTAEFVRQMDRLAMPLLLQSNNWQRRAYWRPER